MAIDSKTFIASSNLDRATWDDQSGELRVTFRKGSTYTYDNVPKSVWQELKSAVSAGAYFQQHIRGVFG